MSELSELNRRRDRLLELLKDEPSNSYNDYDRQLERIEQKIEIAEMCSAEREKTIDEITDKYLGAIESILHAKDLELKLNQALTIYARIMNAFDEVARQLKKQDK